MSRAKNFLEKLLFNVSLAGNPIHNHGVKIDENGNGETTSTSAGPKHKHSIKGFNILGVKQSAEDLPHAHGLTSLMRFGGFFRGALIVKEKPNGEMEMEPMNGEPPPNGNSNGGT